MTDDNAESIRKRRALTTERDRIDRELRERGYRHLAAGQTPREAAEAIAADPDVSFALVLRCVLDDMADEITNGPPDLDPSDLDRPTRLMSDEQLLDFLKDKPELDWLNPKRKP